MNVRVNIVFVFVFLLLILSSCKKETKKKSPDAGFKKDSITLTSQEKTKDIYFRYPSAREMIEYIKTENLPYKPNLVNPVDNIEKYHNTRAKTLNLGVYLADLSYLILYEKTKNTEDYFNAVFNLSSELRIKVPEEEKLVKRITENLYNNDSLIHIAEQYHTRIIDYLRNTGQEKTLAVISTGSYIEGLYLTLNLIGNYSDYQETVRKIVDQKYAFKNLAMFAQEYKEDLNISYSVNYLNEINAFFDQLPVIKEKTVVKRNKEHNLVIEGGEKTIISRENFMDLKEKIDTIRTEIVQNKMDKE